MPIKPDHYLQFKITLRHIRPPIWRRIQVPCNATFWDLHVAIQDAMGWLDHHLHEFTISTTSPQHALHIGVPDEDSQPFESLKDGPSILPGWEIPVAAILNLAHRKATYAYDFGDGWEHEVLLEKIQPITKNAVYPRCSAGRRACPPEDCGGPPGYERLLEILADSEHAEHQDMLSWIGTGYDPNDFDKEAIVFEDPDERWESTFGEQQDISEESDGLHLVDGGRNAQTNFPTGTHWNRVPGIAAETVELVTRAADGFQGFPLATIAIYGPDDQCATKYAAAIIPFDNAEPDPIKRWSVLRGDIRSHQKTATELAAFLKLHNVKTIAISDGMMGCPHEEGIDYPTGESCPHFPFWSGRGRWRGGPVH